MLTKFTFFLYNLQPYNSLKFVRLKKVTFKNTVKAKENLLKPFKCLFFNSNQYCAIHYTQYVQTRIK